MTMVGDHHETLRRIAVRDDSVVKSMQSDVVPSALDYRACGIAQIAALVAAGGSEPSYRRAVEIALLGGATPEELVAILLAVAAPVGIDRAVAAAPRLGLALGYDVSAAVDELPAAQASQVRTDAESRRKNYQALPPTEDRIA